MGITFLNLSDYMKQKELMNFQEFLLFIWWWTSSIWSICYDWSLTYSKLSSGTIPHIYFSHTGTNIASYVLTFLKSSQNNNCYRKQFLSVDLILWNLKFSISVILCIWEQYEAKLLEATYRVEEKEALKCFIIGPLELWGNNRKKCQLKPISQAWVFNFSLITSWRERIFLYILWLWGTLPRMRNSIWKKKHKLWNQRYLRLNTSYTVSWGRRIIDLTYQNLSLLPTVK